MAFASRYNPPLTWLYIVSFLSQQEQLKTLYFIGGILHESLVEEVCKKKRPILVLFRILYSLQSDDDILGVKAILIVAP